MNLLLLDINHLINILNVFLDIFYLLLYLLALRPRKLLVLRVQQLVYQIHISH